ncbi:J domain-containing protein [Rhizobium sp. FKL33]|uniref:J domain-containing protein n=1 Tax=Rhizobium sp. FKL33 TaxID=2562307 RepID=UPI0010BFD599|nr:J domain-containing protein [Rhizobium sp. FKL33]
MTRRYPWTILDIDPTSDQKEIRKAYARRLKVTRPDEDPAGFQALVEARDAALEESHWVTSDEEGEGAAENASPEDAAVAPVVPSVEADGPAADLSGRDLAEAVTVEAKDAPALTPSDPSDAKRVVVELSYPAPDTEATAGESPAEAHDDDEEELELWELLEETRKTQPWRRPLDLWGNVFDALENLPLSQFDEALGVALRDLLDQIQSGDLKPHDQPGVLRELDRRFDLLSNDRRILRHMRPEDADSLIDALSDAAERRGAADAPAQPQTLDGVDDLDPGLVALAFAREPKMIAYFERAIRERSYPWAFSVVGLLFPAPFAFYYRLGKLAWFAAILAIANAILRSPSTREGLPMVNGFYGLLVTIYIVVALSTAFNWRKLRLAALSEHLAPLKANAAPYERLAEAAAAFGKPDRTKMALGIFILLAAVFLRLVLQ